VAFAPAALWTRIVPQTPRRPEVYSESSTATSSSTTTLSTSTPSISASSIAVSKFITSPS